MTNAVTGDSLFIVTNIDLMPPHAVPGTALLQQYCVDSRSDDGALRIELLVDHRRKNHLILLEVWRDQAAFEAHEMADHTRGFRTELHAMLGSPYDQRLNLLPLLAV